MNTTLNSQRTQRHHTSASYQKVAQYLKTNFIGKFSVLDYGAGHGHGTAILQEVSGHYTDSFEPSPQSWNPTYTQVTQIKKKYDIIVCLHVVNVLVKHERDKVLRNIYDLLTPKGTAIIGARKWKGDVNQAKSFMASDTEPHGIYVLGNNTTTYQIGFDGTELQEYIQSLLPVEVIDMKSNFSKSSVVFYK